MGSFGDEEGLLGPLLGDPGLAVPGRDMSPSGAAFGLVLAGGEPSRPGSDRAGARPAEGDAFARGRKTSTTSPAVPKRSAGDFFMRRPTTWTSSEGTSGFDSLI